MNTKKIYLGVGGIVVVIILIFVLRMNMSGGPEKNTIQAVSETPAPVMTHEASTSAQTNIIPVTATPTQTPVPKTTPISTPQPAHSTTSVQSKNIIIKNYDFSPNTLTIKKGTTITWTNQDIAKHTVTADDNSFTSEFFGQGKTFAHTFTETGTYTYHCEPHPYMKATIIVTE